MSSPGLDRRVLIIDDEPSWVEVLSRDLRRQGYHITVAYDAASGKKAVVDDDFDGVVLLDLRLPDADGMDLIEPLLSARPTLRIIMMTAHGTSADEELARRRGIYLFVSKSEGKTRILAAVESAAALLRQAEELVHYRELLGERYRFAGILTRSVKMRNLFDTLEHVVDSKVTVLLNGASGTGKELVARALHYEGVRKAGPFVAVNCGGIPESLLESELFGHEKGAFTGAVAMKKGKFELADGGTLFLDEIGEMPLHLQVKLLRAIQERQVERIGGTAPRPIDVRIVSATHRDLVAMVREGRFREDLYYRLAVFPVVLPPLCERDGDIPLLAQHFLDKAIREEGRGPRTLSPAALDLLEAYPFPGNVRELENIINRAVLVATGDAVLPADLPHALLKTVGGAPPPSALDANPRLAKNGSQSHQQSCSSLEMALDTLFTSLDVLPRAEDVERTLIEHAIRLADGNVGEAARALGLSRATVYRRLRQDDASA